MTLTSEAIKANVLATLTSDGVKKPDRHTVANHLEIGSGNGGISAAVKAAMFGDKVIRAVIGLRSVLRSYPPSNA